MNLLQKAANLVEATLQGHCSETVTLTVETQVTTNITAAIVRPEARLLRDPQNVQVVARLTDFLILAADYAIGGQPVTPARGHLLARADGRVYQVVPLPNEPCYRPMTQNSAMYRIHTQEVRS